ncbi:hypothetical protein M8J77_009228 [Diaphorina citri]|nr:hypothetical protein M8J77_009228 [Diaphorina citri]
MLLVALKLLTLFGLVISSAGQRMSPGKQNSISSGQRKAISFGQQNSVPSGHQCTKYTPAVLGENSDAAPIVIKGLAIRSIPEYLNVTDNRYFGYYYDAEIWLIRIYKGHEHVAKFLNITNYDDTTLYSIIDR